MLLPRRALAGSAPGAQLRRLVSAGSGRGGSCGGSGGRSLSGNPLRRDDLGDGFDPWSNLLSVRGVPEPKLSLAHRSQPGSGLHFVFLEGACCTQKGGLLKRLGAMGHRTIHLPYPRLCLDAPHLDPSGPTLTSRWVGMLVDALYSAASEFHENPIGFKNNLCFVHRSFLTPHVLHSPALLLPTSLPLNVMLETRVHLNTTVVLCTASEYAVNLKLHHRFELASEDEQQLRKRLGEMDETRRHKITQRYNELNGHKHLVDFALDNSNPKQSITALLNVLGVTFGDSMQSFWAKRPTTLERDFGQKNKFGEYLSKFPPTNTPK